MRGPVAASCAVLLLAASGRAEDRPLAVAKIALTRSSGGVEQLVFAAKDPALAPSIGSADDPSVAGASLTIVGRREQPVTIPIPPGRGSPGWRVSDVPTLDRYRYSDHGAPGGSSAVRRLSLAAGRGLAIRARTTGVTLDAAQGSVGVRLTTGSRRTCALFDAPSVVVDEPGRFVAKLTATRATNCSAAALGGPRPVVWLFGDSITGPYCRLVREQHPEWGVVCMSVIGETTIDGARRLAGALASAAPSPAVVLVEEGVNDLVPLGYERDRKACASAPALQPASVYARLAAMAAAVRDAGATSIVATAVYRCPVPNGDTCLGLPPDAPGACPGLRCFFDAACALSDLVRTHESRWVDFVVPTTAFLDLLHPNAAGQHVLADRAAGAILAALP